MGSPSTCVHFGYVNGNLFARRSPAPPFSAKARALILDCGTLDWSQINPDIFGSMMQAVVRRDERKKLGMHYTSVENIMKVIRPLFLDDLEEAFAGRGHRREARPLLERISKIQVFDPPAARATSSSSPTRSCGRSSTGSFSGSSSSTHRASGCSTLSVIKLENFYGIEIDDFAHEIAMLSLWLAKHQMNVEFEELFGAEIPLIPLRTPATSSCGNATRLDWRDVCDPAKAAETYVLGNPPYLGGTMQRRRAEGRLRRTTSATAISEEPRLHLALVLQGGRVRRAGSTAASWRSSRRTRSVREIRSA